MKKYLLPLILVVVLVIVAVGRNQQNQELINYKLNGKSVRLLVADSRLEWERGLMNIRKLPRAEGMIFIFPTKQNLTFWNKDTLVDIDLYWISNDKVVGKSFLPSIEKSKQIVTVNSPKPVDKVVELIR